MVGFGIFRRVFSTGKSKHPPGPPPTLEQLQAKLRYVWPDETPADERDQYEAALNSALVQIPKLSTNAARVRFNGDLHRSGQDPKWRASVAIEDDKGKAMTSAHVYLRSGYRHLDEVVQFSKTKYKIALSKALRGE